MTCHSPIETPGASSAPNAFVPREQEDEIARWLLRPCFASDAEILLIAGFDAFDRLLHLERIDGDGSGRCSISPQSWRSTIHAKPAQVIMAHNHISGIARPSDVDLATTREAARGLALPGIVLADHMIFTAAGHFSFWRAGLL